MTRFLNRVQTKIQMVSTKEYVLFISCFVASIIVVYLVPNIFAYIFFSGLLILFYKSENNYFWLALILLLIDPPGGLFPFGDDNYGLPMIKFPAYISFQEIYIYIALIKAVGIKQKATFIYHKEIILLGLYLIFLFAASFIMGMSTYTFLKSIKWILPWTLLFSLPRLLRSREDWDKFFALLFPVIFISLGFQILHYILGIPPAFLLGRNFIKVTGEIANENNNMILYSQQFSVYRSLGCYFIAFITFLGSMYYLLDKRKVFSKNYLMIIMFLSFLTVSLSATRGMIISFLLGFLIFLFFVYRNPKFVLSTFSYLFLFIMLITIFPILEKQIIGVINRFSTVSLFLQGDITAGGTVARFSDYTPQLLKKYYERPITGWGFTNEFWRFKNGHAGMANLLAQVGTIGILIFIYFWWALFITPIKINNKLSYNNSLKNSILVLTIGFIILFIIHSSSGQQFQYLVGYYNTSFAQLIFYCFSDSAIKSAIREEKIIQNARNQV